MRTALALRTSTVTAALAGAMLIPAAGSAFAAAPAAAPSAAASGGGTTEEVTAICVSGPKRVVLGAGTRAELWTTVDGPRVDLYASGEKGVWKVLDRKNPAWLENVQIINPSGAKPVLRWQMQGGIKPSTTSFPALQPGCLRNYELVEDKATPPKPKPSTKPTTKPPVKPKPQTVVVPKGPVAAGAELGTETGEGTGAPVAVAGVGVLSAAALLGAAFAVRSRRARSRG
ncbi:hypothetical protein [Streptomyces sp. NBC_00347]|uniref:hypothetical protein n=1 Tax=Streptomyces sp. NBC_00347 TaxID=2975721 RepID=UPI00225B568A|nr:hypothetical protein [Streptomyces sp. NBC_00347]MCX5122957.1 hypothetical protein [Streptomyces sp. NBC_00347]